MAKTIKRDLESISRDDNCSSRTDSDNHSLDSSIDKYVTTDNSNYSGTSSNNLTNPTSKKGFFNSISRYYNNTIDLIIKNKNVNIALVAGTFTSVTFNILSAYYADKHGFNTSGIEWISYAGETISHSIVSAATFLYFSKFNGKSFKKRVNELLFKITPVTFAISIGVYRPLRNMITDYLMSGGMPPEGATPIAQLALLPFYLIAVDWSLKK